MFACTNTHTHTELHIQAPYYLLLPLLGAAPHPIVLTLYLSAPTHSLGLNLYFTFSEKPYITPLVIFIAIFISAL